MSEYLLLPEAERDLVEIASFLMEEASEAMAARFVRGVFAQARLLSNLPAIGIPCHFRRPELRTVRRFPIKQFPKWLVFYRATDSGVEVVRVLHGARDWAALFR